MITAVKHFPEQAARGHCYQFGIVAVYRQLDPDAASIPKYTR